MDQMKCPKCKKLTEKSKRNCSHCDFLLDAEKLRLYQDNQKKGCLVGVAVLVAFVLIGALLPKEKKASSSTSSVPTIIKNLPWDNSVIPIKNYIENNLKDPSSLEFIRWGNVIKTVDDTYVVNVKYRAKNSFGGYVVKDQIYTMSSRGDILKVNDY